MDIYGMLCFSQMLFFNSIISITYICNFLILYVFLTRCLIIHTALVADQLVLTRLIDITSDTDCACHHSQRLRGTTLAVSCSLLFVTFVNLK